VSLLVPSLGYNIPMGAAMFDVMGWLICFLVLDEVNILRLGTRGPTGARCSSLESEQRELSNVWNPCDDLTRWKSSKIVN
jgi:hypothetical protein